MPPIVEFIAENRTLIIVITVIVVAFMLLRTQQTETGSDEWPAIVKTGQPVIVEFYSNT